MLQVMALIAGCVAIWIGVKAIATGRMQTRRPTHYFDGRIEGGRYLTGSSAVLAGISCLLIGLALVSLAIATGLLLPNMR